ncbi:hypothetical protein FBUS_11084 [Fasciolopsis buskii]|uniref:CUB domain-containing protein n=1 Tax=Fasciolopsis buskii TaxID=27845 RepID=A0A8E0RYK5_9TREM|nr:hypothetical protein FBUS_11084 [Fasciolopsis buski]
MIIQLVVASNLQNFSLISKAEDLSNERMGNVAECGNGLFHVSGSATNFKFSHNDMIPWGIHCTYLFYGNGGGTLHFNFTSLTLKDKSNCSENYLKFRKNKDSENTTFCGENIQGSYLTDTDSFEMLLKTDGNQTPATVDGFYYQGKCEFVNLPYAVSNSHI